MINAKWGCDGVDHETEVSTQPDFVFPPGKLNLVHNASITDVKMCAPDVENTIELVVKNA